MKQFSLIASVFLLIVSCNQSEDDQIKALNKGQEVNVRTEAILSGEASLIEAKKFDAHSINDIAIDWSEKEIGSGVYFIESPFAPQEIKGMLQNSRVGFGHIAQEEMYLFESPDLGKCQMTIIAASVKRETEVNHLVDIDEKGNTFHKIEFEGGTDLSYPNEAFYIIVKSDSSKVGKEHFIRAINISNESKEDVIKTYQFKAETDSLNSAE